MKGIGIQLNPSTGDLMLNVQRDTLGVIAQGLTIGPVTAQNQATLLREGKGAFKAAPLVGIGVSQMLMDSDLLGWNTEIRRQLKADGQDVEKVTITNSEIIINAAYPS